MEFRLLGPLEVREHGRVVGLGGRKQRAVLAQLLVRANQVVSTDRLIDEIWGDEPPEAARNALQSYVSRLRAALGDGGRIEGRPPGYLLRADAGEVDALRFEALVRDARARITDAPERAAETLREALGLWRGPPLADLADELSLRAEIARLDELRLAAVEDRITAELALGLHAELVAELEGLVEEHPLRERLWSLLMLALYRSGRQAEALAAYQRARRVLADELGLDPSPELRLLQGQILRQDAALEPEGERLRGYRLLEQIGEGSFGVVYRAIQPHVGREVAVKMILPALANDAAFIRRFEAEAQLVARLEHPRIVPLYDYWREPDAAYLVMRWLRGGSLKRALEEGALPVDRAASVVDQVASGLAAAHRHGVVHRDVKPANVLLDEDENAYLSDFGIATDVGAGRAGPTSPDTSAYLSPEQIRGEPPTPRSDIYSLGVVLYEALAGEHPFAAVAPEELASRHLSEPLPPLRIVRDDVPPSVDEVIARATAKDAEDRYADPEALAGALRDAVAPARPAAALPAPARNPYKGLRPFEEADAADFFGREDLTARLLERLGEESEAGRFLALVGASGSGKSSVVRAGLFPALRQGAVPGSADWFLVEMFPGAHPLEEVEAALLRIAVNPPPSLIEQLERDEHGLLRAVKRVLPAGASELLLFVDQFEELFTLVDDEERRRHFLESLAAAASDPRSRLRVVITLRADFYDRPLEYPLFAELLRVGVETVVPLSPEELARAIARPAERVGVAVEPSAVAEMVAEVSAQPAALPMLEYALTEIFERKRDGTLTLGAYREIGGVSAAVAGRAEQLYESATEPGREAARQLFLRLVTLGDATEDTRRRVSRAELASLEIDQEALDEVIDAFGRHRLLSFDRDPQTRLPTVEVAHEALLRVWGRLRGWIEAAREDVRMERRLAAETQEWEASERDSSFLLRGSRLDLFEAWAQTSGVALARAEREFLEASLAQRDAERAEEEARRAREAALERRLLTRLRALVAVLAIAALVAAGLSFFAFDQRQEARAEASRAEREARIATARELAAGAVANLASDPERAILLALEAAETTRSADGTVIKEAQEALHRAVQASRVVFSVSGLFGIQFSPDGKRLATTNADGTARIWDARTGEELVTFEGHTARTLSVDFTEDGKRLATSSEDGTAKVWDAETGEELQTFVGHEAGLRSPHFSPDGRKLATTSFDGTTRLWDVATGKQLRVLNHTGGIEFSPDGTRLVVSDPPVTVYDLASGAKALVIDGMPDPRDATWSNDGARIAVSDGDGFGYLFDAESGERLLTLVGHTSEYVGEIVFSADDARVATTGSDGTVRIWDAATGLELLELQGLGGNVEGIAFNRDGTLIAASSGSGIATVWDITPGGSREVLTIPAHEDSVWGLAYSPDGAALATGSSDGTAKLWDPVTGKRLLAMRGEGPVSQVAFSLDGSSLVTGGAKPRIWDAATGEEKAALAGDEEHVSATLKGASTQPETSSVAFSPDGRRVLTGSDDGTARIWEAASGEELIRLEGHRGWVIAVGFSPDGKRVATGSQDETAKVWDAETGEELATMARHQDNVNALTFSPDGTRLYTASEDGRLKVWDTETGRELRVITGHAAGLLDITFSPDGTRLATAGRDNALKLWDPDSGTELLTIAGHASGASAVAFSPDGTRLAAGGEDGSVRIFTLDVEELVGLARDRVTRSVTEDECRQYLHVERCPRA